MIQKWDIKSFKGTKILNIEEEAEGEEIFEAVGKIGKRRKVLRSEMRRRVEKTTTK